jgi:hypothetical protein
MQGSGPKIETDPNLAADQARAQQTLISSLQTEAQFDTANLMARYGTRLALAGSGMAPISPAAPIAAATPPIRF